MNELLSVEYIFIMILIWISWLALDLASGITNDTSKKMSQPLKGIYRFLSLTPLNILFVIATLISAISFLMKEVYKWIAEKSI